MSEIVLGQIPYVLQVEEIISSIDGIGYQETLYISESGEKIDRVLEPVAWKKDEDGDIVGAWPGDGSGRINLDKYGQLIKPSAEEYAQFRNETEPITLQYGYRYWSRKPTKEMMKNAKWEVRVNE